MKREENTTQKVAEMDTDSDNKHGYKAALWERITAVVCAVSILVVVFILVLQKEPFADPNHVVLIRIVLSLAVAIIGAVIPGFLHVDLTLKGVTIRAFGALALFVITFFFTPSVLPISEISDIKQSTEETLSEVGRLSTKFESVFVQAVYELPLEESDVKLLEEAFVEINQVIMNGNEKSPEGLTLVQSYDVQNKTSKYELSIELDKILDVEFIELSPKINEIIPFITFLQKPSLKIGINHSLRKTEDLVNSFLQLSESPDLSLFAHGFPVDPDNGNIGKVILLLDQKRLLVAWNGFEYPQEKWATTRKIISIQDLGNAQLALMLSKSGNIDEQIEKIASKMVPLWVNFRFDNNFVTFVDLEPTDSVLKWKVYNSIFPSAEDVLNNKASQPFELANLWGF